MIGNFLSVAMKVLILFLLMSVGFVLGRKKCDDNMKRISYLCGVIEI